MKGKHAGKKIKQVRTGIKGLDKLLCGGVPKGSAILLSGSPGSGKSILSTQILVNACNAKERCLYVSFEETTADIIKQANAFGWPIEKYMQNKSLKILSFDVLKDRDIIDRMFSTIKNHKIDIVIIDSLTALQHTPSFLFEAERFDVMVTQKKTRFVKHEEWLMHAAMHHIVQSLRKNPVTAFLISDIVEDTSQLSSDGISEFLCDGIILLKYLSIGAEESRLLEVRKMRFTDHLKGVHNFSITRAGVSISEESTVLMK